MNFKKSCLALAIAVCGIAANATDGNNVYVRGGYFKVSDFVGFSRYERLAYISGAMDGVRASAVWGASGNRYQKLLDCVAPMTANQLLAIADKWFSDNPETWHLSVNHEFITMMYKVCKI